MTRRLRVGAWLAAVMLTAASPAFAQKKPPTIPPGQAKRAQQVPGTSGLVSESAGGIDLTGTGSGRVRTLGSWLDDASVLAPGETWLALSASRWSMPIATGGDAPVVDVSAGLSRRVHASLTIPYFRATDRDGASFRGLGDLYLGAKVMLRDPATHGVGVAVGPTLELLSRTSTNGTGLDRVNWILPLNLEHRLRVGRVYGSTGYFSRGVFFTSGAYEHPVTDRLIVAAALAHSYATDRNAVSEAIGLGRIRLDLSGTVAYSVAPALALFGSIGRTVWGLDPDSTRLLATVGVSVNMAAQRTPAVGASP